MLYNILLLILECAGWMVIIGALCAITMTVGCMLVYIFGNICNKLGQAIEFLSK